jgi:hypothetical protein
MGPSPNRQLLFTLSQPGRKILHLALDTIPLKRLKIHAADARVLVCKLDPHATVLDAHVDSQLALAVLLGEWTVCDE